MRIPYVWEEPMARRRCALNCSLVETSPLFGEVVDRRLEICRRLLRVSFYAWAYAGNGLILGK